MSLDTQMLDEEPLFGVFVGRGSRTRLAILSDESDAVFVDTLTARLWALSNNLTGWRVAPVVMTSYGWAEVDA
jgi:hypothetical protein